MSLVESISNCALVISMDPLKLSLLDSNLLPPMNPACKDRTRKEYPQGNREAFSLVEVVIAIGIVAFAFVAILGLLPSGLKTFRQAMDQTIVTRVTQMVGNEAQQADFDNIINITNPPYYFDDQGDPVTNASKAIYVAQLLVVTNNATTNIWSANGTNVKTLVIQVAHNPGNKVSLSTTSLSLDPTLQLWSSSNAIGIATRTIIIARNSTNASALLQNENSQGQNQNNQGGNNQGGNNQGQNNNNQN